MKPWSPPKGMTVVTAYAEDAKGPGWVNYPVWVILRDGNNHIHEYCIQPDEQSDEVLTLYAVSKAAHLSMVRAVSKRRRK